MTTPPKPTLEVIEGGVGNMLLRLMQLCVRSAHLSDEEIAESEALVEVLKKRGNLKLIKGGMDRQPDPGNRNQGE